MNIESVHSSDSEMSGFWVMDGLEVVEGPFNTLNQAQRFMNKKPTNQLYRCASKSQSIYYRRLGPDEIVQKGDFANSDVNQTDLGWIPVFRRLIGKMAKDCNHLFIYRQTIVDMEYVRLFIAINETRGRWGCDTNSLIGIVDSIIDGIKADGILCNTGILNEYKRLTADEAKHPFDCKCALHC